MYCCMEQEGTATAPFMSKKPKKLLNGICSYQHPNVKQWCACILKFHPFRSVDLVIIAIVGDPIVSHLYSGSLLKILSCMSHGH